MGHVDLLSRPSIEMNPNCEPIIEKAKSLNPFYVQINKGHLRKVGGYSSWNVVLTTNNNKDEDNNLKNHTQDIMNQASDR